MKYLKTISTALFIICVPPLLLTGGIALALNSPWLYAGGFEKYGISQATGLEPAELEKAARGLIAYFNSPAEDIDITVTKDGAPMPLFNEKEIAHLRDVKALFWLDYRVLLYTLVYALLYAGVCLFRWRSRRRLARGLLGGGGFTLALIVLLGIGIALNFEALFWQFHLIIFANDFWLLDPSRDYLIMLFPQGFWYDTALFCTAVTAAGAVLLAGTGVCLRLVGNKDSLRHLME
ncbi:TIGR01906 family membrane protein [Chloroflexota bacterium]